MAEIIHVPGPTQIFIDGSGLGFTDNDVLPEFTIEQFNAPVTTSVGGDAPEEYVNLGSMATINFTLVKWEPGLMVVLEHGAPDATVAGAIGTIGQTWFGKGQAVPGSDQSFVVDVKPLLAGKIQYSFPRCVLNGPDAFRYIDWGNQGRKVAISFVAVPDDSSPRKLYTPSATV